MSNRFQSGNTIRLSCVFRDFDNQITDPTLVRIIFYDYKYKIIEETSLSQQNKNLDGSYFYDYIIPEGHQKIFYEWYGEINGTPTIKREFFIVDFI